MERIRTKRFELLRILVPIDYSDTSMFALEHALQLASRGGAELVVMHVMEEVMCTDGGSENTSHATANNLRLQTLVSSLQQRTEAHVSGLLLSGTPARKILETALEACADLILIGAQGFEAKGEERLGSTAAYVARRSECPVLTVHRGFGQQAFSGYRQILLPIDNTPSTRLKVPYAAYLARLCGAQLHVLGLCDQEDPIAQESMKALVRSVERFLKPYEISYKSSMRSGTEKVQQLLAYAAEQKADLIALMLEEDKPAEGHAISHAELVMHQSKVPVFSIGEPLVAPTLAM